MTCRAPSPVRSSASIVVVVLVAALGSSLAGLSQAQTVIRTGCDGPDFGPVGCSLAELVPSGSIALDLPNAMPAVRVIFDQFEVDGLPINTPPTDYSRIRVRLSARGLDAVLVFEDVTPSGQPQWQVQGSGMPGSSNAKRETISYRVRTVDPNATPEPTNVARIRGAELAIPTNSRAVTAGLLDPFIIEVRDRTSPDLVAGNLFTYLRSESLSFPSVLESFYYRGTFSSPQAEVLYEKEVLLDGGDVTGNSVTLPSVTQVVALTPTVREVGCVPGTFGSTGVEQVVQLCELAADQAVPAVVPTFDQASGNVVQGTFNPNSFEEKDFHDFQRLGSERVDFPFQLDPIVPTIQVPNANVLSGFDVDNGAALFMTQTVQSLINGSIVGQWALLVDRVSGESRVLCQRGDNVVLPSGSYQITDIVDTRIADGNLAHVTVFLMPTVGSVVQGILVKDASAVFSTSQAPIVASLLPGDMLSTAAGLVALQGNPNLVDLHDATGIALFLDAAGPNADVYRGLVGAGADVERIVGTGDPTDAGDGSEVTAVLGGGGICENGAALVLATQVPGNPASTSICAYHFESPVDSGATIFDRRVLCVGDSLPGPGSLTATQIAGARCLATDVVRRGEVGLTTQNQVGTAGTGIFGYDDGLGGFGLTRNVVSGDIITPPVGPPLSITEVQVFFDRRGLLLEEKQTWLSVAQANAFSDPRVLLAIRESTTVARVPDVIGRDQALAETNLVDAGLSVGLVTDVPSEDFAVGETVSQSIPGGSSVASGTAVDLEISLPEPGLAAMIAGGCAFLLALARRGRPVRR